MIKRVIARVGVRLRVKKWGTCS